MNELSLNFDLPVKSFNGGKFVSRGEGIHPTRSINSYEIIYVANGVLHMFEEDKKFCMPAGNALLLYPGRRHGGEKPYTEDLSFYWVHFDIEKNRIPEHDMKIPQHVVIKNPIGMTELFHHFLDGQESGQQNSVQASLLIMQMLAEMSLAGANQSPSTARFTEQAFNYIKLNLREVSGTAEIARALKCNPDYLGRIFKNDFGRTITEEIHRQRIAYARTLLLDSKMNVSEIAEDSGFEDPVYFRKIFKRVTGVTPREYRNQYSRIHVNTEYR